MALLVYKPADRTAKPVAQATKNLHNAAQALQRNLLVPEEVAHEMLVVGFVDWLGDVLAGRDDAELIRRAICRDILCQAQAGAAP